MNAYRLAWAEPEDARRLVPLMRALYRHDLPEAPDPAPDTVTRHIARLLSPVTPHRLVIAWGADGHAAGLAAVAQVTSISDPRPENRVQIDLKELFVLTQHRSAGLGHALMAWVEAEARAAGACRIDWHVKRDNQRGIAFYEGWGGQVVTSRLSMRKILRP